MSTVVALLLDKTGKPLLIGQQSAVNSLGVVLASDQPAVPVSGTVTVVDSVPLSVAGTVAVSNLPGTQPVSGTVAVSGTVPVSAASLPLPSGASTETTLAAVNTKLGAALPLPTGAATETTLAAVNTKVPAQGQALAGASLPVVLPAAQVTTLTPPAAIAGFALEAGHLATLDTKMPAQGQALAAASLPVVLTAAQITTLTPPTTVGTNAKRNAGVLHRNAITAVDKLSAPGALTSISAVAGGSLTAGTYNLAASASNAYGNTTISNAGTVQSVVTSAGNLTGQFTLPQVANATVYDLFCSTDSAPKWVARITETQRANANGTVVTAVGTVSNGSSLGAGVIKVQVPGTGLQTSSAVFATNTAYLPANATAVNAAGYSRAHVKVQMTIGGYGVAPTLTLVPFFGNQNAAIFHFGQSQPLPLVTGPGQSLGAELVIDVDGEPAFGMLVDTLTGTDTMSVSVWIELA